jgi:hypothetical protein
MSDRTALAALLEHLQAHLNELEGEGLFALSLALSNLTDDKDVLDLNALRETDIAELRTLVDLVAAQNGHHWVGTSTLSLWVN